RPKCEASTSFAPLSLQYRMVGSAASILVRSAILPSCIGTFRSSRKKTLLSFSSNSSINFNPANADFTKNLYVTYIRLNLPCVLKSQIHYHTKQKPLPVAVPLSLCFQDPQ